MRALMQPSRYPAPRNTNGAPQEGTPKNTNGRPSKRPLFLGFRPFPGKDHFAGLFLIRQRELRRTLFFRPVKRTPPGVVRIDYFRQKQRSFAFAGTVKNYLNTKLKDMIAISSRIPSKKKGIVYFVGNDARFVTTTSASAAIAPTIKPNKAPFINTTAIVIGKKKAVIDITAMPTQAI